MKNRNDLLKEVDILKDTKDLLKKFRRIINVIGIDIELYECKYITDSMSFPMNRVIHIGFEQNENSIYANGELKGLMINNVDKFHNNFNIDDYKEIPSIIIVLFHELGHMLTMNWFDSLLDSEQKIAMNKLDEFDKEKYRELSYEKLADNLGYELLYINYDQVIKILLEERIRFDRRRVYKNLRIADEMKDKYIKY